jgi:hypothetical protein
MAWTNFKFYQNEYLHGDQVVIPEQSFERWEEQAVTALNRRNLTFNDVNVVNSLREVRDRLNDFANERTNISEVYAYLNNIGKVESEAIGYSNDSEDYTYVQVTLNVKGLIDKYYFRIEYNQLVHADKISISNEAAPKVIQMLVCEYAEAMYIYAQNTNDKMGLQSESNFGYSWSRAGSKDEAYIAYLRHLNSIVAKWVGQTTWRDYFYGIGKMVSGF